MFFLDFPFYRTNQELVSPSLGEIRSASSGVPPLRQYYEYYLVILSVAFYFSCSLLSNKISSAAL